MAPVLDFLSELELEVSLVAVGVPVLAIPPYRRGRRDLRSGARLRGLGSELCRCAGLRSLGCA